MAWDLPRALAMRVARWLGWSAGLLGMSLSSASLAQVSGTVSDGATLQPIAGARVSVQASQLETTTDAAGVFTLAGVSGDVVVVAAAPGWFNHGQPVTAPAAGLAFQLEAVPTFDDPAYSFPAPSACATCHPTQYGQWATSPMAHAGDNTWVYDTYDGTGTPGGTGGFVYLDDSALAAENPASECRSCHQPEPWILDPYSALEPLGALSQESLHGISCVICHQTADIDETRPNFPGMWPGIVSFQRTPPGEVVMYGTLGDVSYEAPGVMRASYQPELASVVCAACHQDKNDPDLDGDFEEDDGVISEPTYLEWLDSPYADAESPEYSTCAGCHMRPISANAACIVLPELSRPEGDVREHTFRGTDADFLENALSLEVEAAQLGGELNATVTVTNDRTGHHVPTGVTIRNAILLVEAVNVADGAPLEHLGDQMVHELGGVGDPSEGYFAGLPGKLFAKVNHDANGAGPTFFTDAAGITFDTRIPALASDVTSYVFALPPGGGSVALRARVIYRRSWRALVDAKGWTTDGHGAPLEDLAAPSFGHVMASAETTLEVEPSGAGGSGGGGSTGGGSEGGGTGGGGGPGVGEPDDGGCDCASAGRTGGRSAAPLALLTLGLIMASRRSRRR
jgi:uncharacterized membrane protein YgcG